MSMRPHQRTTEQGLPSSEGRWFPTGITGEVKWTCFLECPVSSGSPQPFLRSCLHNVLQINKGGMEVERRGAHLLGPSERWVPRTSPSHGNISCYVTSATWRWVDTGRMKCGGRNREMRKSEGNHHLSWQAGSRHCLLGQSQRNARERSLHEEMNGKDLKNQNQKQETETPLGFGALPYSSVSLAYLNGCVFLW